MAGLLEPLENYLGVVLQALKFGVHPERKNYVSSVNALVGEKVFQ